MFKTVYLISWPLSNHRRLYLILLSVLEAGDGKQPPASVGGHDLRLVPLLPPAQLVARDDPVLRLRRRRLPPDDERLGRRSFDGHVLRGVGWHVGVGPGDGIQMIRIE